MQPPPSPRADTHGRQAENERRDGDLIRWAVVESVDLEAATVEVRLGDKVVGPIDWFMGRAGKTVIWSPPSVGEQGLLFSAEGDTEAAVFLSGIRSSKFAIPAGETRELIRFEDLATIAYDAEGHELRVDLPAGGKLAIVAPGGMSIGAEAGLSIDADIAHTGDQTTSGTVNAQSDVVGGGKSLKSHTHMGVHGATGSPQ